MASQVTGAEATIRALRRVGREMQGAVPIIEMGGALRTAIRRQLRKHGSGRQYRAPTRSRNVARRWSRYPGRWRASAPAAPPASPTGNLRRAVTMHLTQNKQAVTVGVHGARGIGALAQILERGTNPRIGARPFVFPTFQRERGKLERLAIDRTEKKVINAQKLLDEVKAAA